MGHLRPRFKTSAWDITSFQHWRERTDDVVGKNVVRDAEKDGLDPRHDLRLLVKRLGNGVHGRNDAHRGNDLVVVVLHVDDALVVPVASDDLAEGLRLVKNKRNMAIRI